MDNITINITEAPITVTITASDGTTGVTKAVIEGVLTGDINSHSHSTYILHSLATAANDFLVASGAGVFIKKTVAQVKAILGFTDPADNNTFLTGTALGAWVWKTLAETRTMLGLGTAAYTASTDYATASHTQSQTTVTAAAFQTPMFANPLSLDATTYKDFKCGIITGNTTINMTGEVDGDAGMIELIIDGTGGYTVALGVMFTKKLGTASIVNTLNADNFISWRKVGTDIVYTVVKKV